jgi:hypothetical protein
MDRRDFLKASTMFIAAGAILPKAAKSMFTSRFQGAADKFSLEVITGNVDLAVKLLEDFIKAGNLGSGGFNYSEYPMHDYVMGDLVYVKNNNLIDYTVSRDDTSEGLMEIRKKLSLPSMISNPVRLRLYRNSGKDVKEIIVAQKGKIIKRITPDMPAEYAFYGKTGKLSLDVKNSTARISEASCKHKICKQMSSIRKPGDYIICIPNEIQIFAE